MNNLSKISNSNPLFSVIIAVYNNEKYVISAINSVLNQGFSDFEIIIIDDGSTDGTGEILDKITCSDSRIKVFHQHNQWIYPSFNNGIKKSQGEYIYILNSDDKLTNGSLLRFRDVIEKNGHPDVVWTRVVLCKSDDEQNILSERIVDKEFRGDCYIDLRKAPEKWLDILQSGVMVNQANLYKREIMLNHPFRDDYYGADYLFNLDVASNIDTCYFLNEPAYLFFEYSEGQNASIGKYYGYEHDMYNEFYIRISELIKIKGLYDENNINPWKKNRRDLLITEIYMLLNFEKNKSLSDKIQILKNETWDDVLAECFTISGEKGYEKVLIRELRKYFSNNPISDMEKAELIERFGNDFIEIITEPVK